MNTKQPVQDFRKGEWDPSTTYSIDEDGNFDCSSAESFEAELKRFPTLTEDEKRACFNFTVSMKNKYGAYSKEHSHYIHMYRNAPIDYA